MPSSEKETFKYISEHDGPQTFSTTCGNTGDASKDLVHAWRKASFKEGNRLHDASVTHQIKYSVYIEVEQTTGEKCGAKFACMARFTSKSRRLTMVSPSLVSTKRRNTYFSDQYRLDDPPVSKVTTFDDSSCASDMIMKVKFCIQETCRNLVALLH